MSQPSHLLPLPASIRPAVREWLGAICVVAGPILVAWNVVAAGALASLVGGLLLARR